MPFVQFSNFFLALNRKYLDLGPETKFVQIKHALTEILKTKKLLSIL